MGSAEMAVEECKSALMKQEGGSHYKDCKIQPVEYIHANGLGYIEGAVIKYVTRYKAKNGAEDIKKAIHFLELLLQLEYPTNNAAHKAPSLCDSEVDEWADKDLCRRCQVSPLFCPKVGIKREVAECAAFRGKHP